MERDKAKKSDMNHFVIKIADLRIGINALSSSTYGYCIKYLSDETPDFSVAITQEDIQREIEDYKSIEREANIPYCETIAAYRKIVEKVIDYNIFLMHGAVIALGNEAYMFSAPSGTGKTTHIKQWLKNLESAYVVNGDKPLLKVTEQEILACGTPWCGKERLGTNVTVPLKGIIQIQRSENNHIERVSFPEIYPFLLQQTYMFKDAAKARKTLSLLSELYHKLSFWHFYCNNFKSDCFHIAYDALIRNGK